MDEKNPFRRRAGELVLAVILGILTSFLPFLIKSEFTEFLSIPGMIAVMTLGGGFHSVGSSFMFFFAVGQGCFYVCSWYLVIRLGSYLLRRKADVGKSSVG